MYIYAIGNNTNKTKIGISANPNKRLSQLQTGNPESLHIYYTFAINESTAHKFEKAAHHDIAHKRLKGEWFNLTPDEAKSFMIYTEIMQETIEKSF